MQKPKIKLQIVIFLEFWLVFTVSSFVRNSVYNLRGFFTFLYLLNQGKIICADFIILEIKICTPDVALY